MSLAVLARKTKAKQRIRTRGKFILNMTGRGNVLGMNAKMSRGNCKGLTNCAGKRAACCVGVGGSRCCEFPHGGQPAPQMGYRVYLNRKSKGAYRPAGGKQCKTLAGCTSAKTVWKQGNNLDASVVTTNRRDNILACNSDVYTAKRDTCTCEEFLRYKSIGTQTNTMTVGQSGTTYGFSLLAPVIGNFTPATINGTSIGTSLTGGNVTYDSSTINQIFQVRVVGSGILPQTHFTAISFVDDCNVRTYKTAETSAFGAGPGGTIWQWKADGLGGRYTAAEEDAYWASVVNKSLDVYVIGGTSVNTSIPTVTNLCYTCCCPVKKNICGCRATDLVRYTRINKSFGCQTTKAVRMGRSASEQIARRRAAVDCIKPKHRTIYLTINASGQISFDGCCGNQCLIQGQRYSFQIKNNYNDVTFRILWCQQVVGTDIGIFDDINIEDDSIANVSFTVPTFNNKLPCKTPEKALLGILSTNSNVSLDYCKEAFKRPQMLGSCSGR